MGMCCEKKTMTGWRNVWSMKWRVSGQEVDQRKLGERLWKKTAEHVDWIPWFVVDGESRLGWLMTTMSVSGWMFLLVPAHPGSPDKFHRAVKWLCVCVCVLLLLIFLCVVPYSKKRWPSISCLMHAKHSVSYHIITVSYSRQKKISLINQSTTFLRGIHTSMWSIDGESGLFVCSGVL